MNPQELLSLSQNFLRRKDALKKADILSLREVVREHNRLYHQAESPVISDTEYDQLFHALARAEADYDMLDADSPTAHLAILASEHFQKVPHQYPMISLDNTYNIDEVRDFEKRMRNVLKNLSPVIFSYYVQPKYDGLGLAVVYRYGVFNQAITRGSGVEGEDVTLTAREIENLPKTIPALSEVERMEVRGEVMMSRTTFDAVNRERLSQGEKLFANPRNCASGSLRQLDPLITRSRKLQFFAYAIPQIEQGIDEEKSVSSYHAMMDMLKEWGFGREDFPFQQIQGIEELVKRIQHETEHRQEYFDFDIDGMVLKFDDMMLWDDLGRTEHHPRYAIAYKFPAKQVRTRLLSIEHSVGRTGTITPVANLEPVEVTGVIVRRATLHNYDELIKKGVREGDYVFVMRAGEVIPEIVSVLTELRDGSEKIIEIPKICPICSTTTQQDEGMVAIYCPNPHCGAKIQGQLEMFVSKQGMNIDGFGEKQVELFLELGWITDFASIFSLGDFRDKILELEGYKEKSVTNLLTAIEQARHTTLDRILTSIGIPNVGKKTAKQLTERIFQISQNTNIPLLETLHSLSEDDLLEIRDIGPETASAFVEYMRNNQDLFDRLFHVLDIAIPLSSSSAFGLLSGKSFCVTGTFSSLSREAIHEMIEKNGGEVRTSVSSKLDYLIVGESAGSKKPKAESLGVKLLELEAFIEMIAG